MTRLSLSPGFRIALPNASRVLVTRMSPGLSRATGWPGPYTYFTSLMVAR